LDVTDIWFSPFFLFIANVMRERADIVAGSG
jgi:hypothetical protein